MEKNQVKQIVLNHEGSLTIAGFGTIQEGAITEKLRDAIVAHYPELKDKFKEITVTNEEHKAEHKAEEKKVAGKKD